MNLEDLRQLFPQGVWLLDTEYATPTGDPVIPVCAVGIEIFSGRCIRQFFELHQEYENPFPIGAGSLFVAYAAHAEWGCFLSLGWKRPVHVLDLHAELRNEISGRTPPPGRESYDARLIGAMDYYGLDSISAAEKRELQERISRGHPFTAEERKLILDYCESDVRCLEELLPAMAPAIDLPYAIFRGRYTKAVACIERAGIPVDRACYKRLIRHRPFLKSRLIEEFEREYGPSPYVKTKDGDYAFSFRKLQVYLDQLGLLAAWQVTPKNRLKTREGYLQEMARTHPALQPLFELVKRTGDLRQFGLKIGSDDRTRCSVMPFKAETGRNQPKGKEFLFVQSSWTRSLVKPPLGYAVAYIDWSAAEFAIAARLSQDAIMQRAYDSGDPYLDSAINMGFAAAGVTKQTAGPIRDVMKLWLLSAQYGGTAKSLVTRLPPDITAKINNPVVLAEDFLEKHRRMFSRYWQWAEARVEIFIHESHCEETLFGWRHRLDARLEEWQVRNQSLNFPMQATCGEILRWACVRYRGRN